MKLAEIELGARIFSISTGRIDMLKKGQEIAEGIAALPGFVGMHFSKDGYYIIWLFETVEDAENAEKVIQAQDIMTGNNICEFEMMEDDTIEFRGVAAGKDKGKGYVVADGSN